MKTVEVCHTRKELEGFLNDPKIVIEEVKIGIIESEMIEHEGFRAVVIFTQKD